MKITEQNILGVDAHTTDLQILSCGHQIREVKGIKNFLLEDCILCFEPLIGNRKLCIYNCGHMMHVDCLINSQKIHASRDTCLTCINKITSMTIYENSKKLEESELYSCIDDQCNERRKQERMAPFFLIKDYFSPQNQVFENQNPLLEICQNIAPALNDDEKVKVLEIMTSLSLTDDEKQQQIMNFITRIGVLVNLNSMLLKDNRSPVTNSVMPNVNVNISRRASNITTDNIDTIATTSAAATRYNENQQQPATNHVGAYLNESITTARRSSLEVNESSDIIMEDSRESFFSRIKKIILCRK